MRSTWDALRQRCRATLSVFRRWLQGVVWRWSRRLRCHGTAHRWLVVPTAPSTALVVCRRCLHGWDSLPVLPRQVPVDVVAATLDLVAGTLAAVPGDQVAAADRLAARPQEALHALSALLLGFDDGSGLSLVREMAALHALRQVVGTTNK